MVLKKKPNEKEWIVSSNGHAVRMDETKIMKSELQGNKLRGRQS